MREPIKGVLAELLKAVEEVALRYNYTDTQEFKDSLDKLFKAYTQLTGKALYIWS